MENAMAISRADWDGMRFQTNKNIHQWTKFKKKDTCDKNKKGREQVTYGWSVSQ